METAADRFFQAAEIIVLLAEHCDTRTLGRLCQTNRFLYSYTIPVLWRNIDLLNFSLRQKETKFARQFLRLHQRTRYVRSLKIESELLSIFNDNILDTEERPEWLLETEGAEEYRLSHFLPFTRLTHLVVSSGEHFVCGRIATALLGHWAFMRKEASCFAHISWLIELNPNLTHLTVRLNPLRTGGFRKSIDFRCLVRAIGSLSKLKYLEVHFVPSRESWSTAFRALFIYCPESVETLMLKPSRGGSTQYGFSLEPQEDDLDWDDGPIVLQLRPLPRLKKLILPIFMLIYGPHYTHMLQYCPNLETLEFIFLEPDFDNIIEALTPTVHQYCKHLRHVSVRQRTLREEYGKMAKFLEELPTPLETIYFEHFRPNQFHGLKMFQRHTETLKDIRLLDMEHILGPMVQEILTKCSNLERLQLRMVDGRASGTQLQFLVAEKWASERIRHLELGVRLDRFDAKDPHYRRKAHSRYSDKDNERWEALEKLYRQIGSLTQLEVLAISPTEGCGTTALPQLMTLGDGAPNRKAYLSWLAELKNLREVDGMVRIHHSEIADTFTKAEGTWIAQNWTKLKRIGFLDYKPQKPKRVRGPGAEALNHLIKLKPQIDLRTREIINIDDFALDEVPRPDEYMPGMWEMEY